MISLIVTAALLCPVTKLTTKAEPWTHLDMLFAAKNGGFCARKYTTKVCVVEIIKLGVRNFRITCGEPR